MEDSSENITVSPLPKAEGSPAPVPESERIAALDLMRGVAVMGILLVNISAFSMPAGHLGSVSNVTEFSWSSNVAFGLVYCFGVMKFLPIFACLFGAGLVLQSARLEDRGASPDRIMWRLTFLAVVGLLHALFIWDGDILFFYAMGGMVVYQLRHLSPQLLGPLGVILIFLSPVLFFGYGLTVSSPEFEASLREPRYSDYTSEEVLEYFGLSNHIDVIVMKDNPELAFELERYYYQHGSYKELFQLRRATFLETSFCCGLSFGWTYVGWMLLGTWFINTGVFANPAAHTRLIRRMILLGMLMGLPAALLGFWFEWRDSLAAPYYSTAFTDLGSFGMTLAYIGILMLLSKSAKMLSLMKPITCCGRMAFTNYIAQSLIMVTIFYPYGLGYYGEFDHDELLPFVVCIWVFQLVFSTVWLKFFRFGPLEWVWRMWTYGSIPRMLK